MQVALNVSRLSGGSWCAIGVQDEGDLDLSAAPMFEMCGDTEPCAGVEIDLDNDDDWPTDWLDA